MKSLSIVAFMLLLVFALAAQQGATDRKSGDAEKNDRASGQAVHLPTQDKTTVDDKSNPTEQKSQSEIKANYHGKHSLSLGSMPCAQNDQECRERERQKFPPQEEHL